VLVLLLVPLLVLVPLPLAVAPEDPSAISIQADPEGGAHGCAPFFYGAGCPLEKSLRYCTSRREVCTGKAFSLVRFFDAYQRNELGRAAGETLSILSLSLISAIDTRCENQWRKSEASAFGGFFSFDKRQKKRKQRKTLPRTELTGRFTDAGIFLRDILSRRKTAHIHVRRPPGPQIPMPRIDL
jgi:hypothetical protein